MDDDLRDPQSLLEEEHDSMYSRNNLLAFLENISLLFHLHNQSKESQSPFAGVLSLDHLFLKKKVFPGDRRSFSANDSIYSFSFLAANEILETAYHFYNFCQNVLYL